MNAAKAMAVPVGATGRRRQRRRRRRRSRKRLMRSGWTYVDSFRFCCR